MYSADIRVKVTGVSELDRVSNKIAVLQKSIDALNRAAINALGSGAALAGLQKQLAIRVSLNRQIQQGNKELQAEVSLLKESLSLSRQLAASRRGSGTGSGSLQLATKQAKDLEVSLGAVAAAQHKVAAASQAAATAAQSNNRYLREQEESFARQIRQIKERAQGFESERAVMAKLRDATDQLLNLKTGDARLGKAQLANAKAMVLEEERVAAAVERAVVQQARMTAKLKESAAEAKTLGQQLRSAASTSFKGLQTVAPGLAGRAQNLYQGIKNTATNAAVRGGAVLGGAGLAGLWGQGVVDKAAISAGFAGHANDWVIGGMAQSMAQMTAVDPKIQALAQSVVDLTGQWGLAAAAVAAFWPVLNQAGQASLSAAKKLDDITGASKKAASAMMSVQMAMQMAFGGGLDLGAKGTLDESVRMLNNLNAMAKRIQTAKLTASGRIPGLGAQNASPGLTSFLKDQGGAVARQQAKELEDAAKAANLMADNLERGLRAMSAGVEEAKRLKLSLIHI